MAYDGKLLARARRRLEERRIENEAERQRRTPLCRVSADRPA